MTAPMTASAPTKLSQIIRWAVNSRVNLECLGDNILLYTQNDGLVDSYWFIRELCTYSQDCNSNLPQNVQLLSQFVSSQTGMIIPRNITSKF